MSRKARNIRDLDRSKKPKRSEYDRVLIVCEGKKTERYYFEALIADLRLNTTNVEVDPDSDSSPRSVVLHAKQRYVEDKKLNGRDNCFDRVYCVFDKDEHETYLEAIDSIRTANPKSVFYPITSIPCFEFWLFLHFDITTRPFARSGSRSPGENMEHVLKDHLPNYSKGDKTIYEQVKGKDGINAAIIRARQANNAAESAQTDNPSTNIPDLIEYLRGLGKPTSNTT